MVLPLDNNQTIGKYILFFSKMNTAKMADGGKVVRVIFRLNAKPRSYPRFLWAS